MFLNNKLIKIVDNENIFYVYIFIKIMSKIFYIRLMIFILLKKVFGVLRDFYILFLCL